MLIFNPYDLDHVGMMNDWLADKKKGIDRPCPFYTKPEAARLGKKKKSKKLKGILKAKR